MQDGSRLGVLFASLLLVTGCEPIGNWLNAGDEGESGSETDGEDDGEDGRDEGDATELIDELPPDDDAEELTCVVAMQKDFCWYEFLHEAADCLSNPKDEGRFEDNRRTCTYDSGESIEFDDPVPRPGKADDDHEWSFRTYTSDGEECLRVRDHSTDYDGWYYTLIVGRERAEIAKVDGTTRIKCPNGDIFRADDDDWVADCPEIKPEFNVWSEKDSGSTVLEITAVPQNARLFECADG